MFGLMVVLRISGFTKKCGLEVAYFKQNYSLRITLFYNCD